MGSKPMFENIRFNGKSMTNPFDQYNPRIDKFWNLFWR